MSKKPYLSGAVIACGPTLGWWYWAAQGQGVYGPFFTREAARRDRTNRLKTIPHRRYRSPFVNPIRAKAFVRVENGKPTWRRVQDTIGAAIMPPEGLSTWGFRGF